MRIFSEIDSFTTMKEYDTVVVQYSVRIIGWLKYLCIMNKLLMTGGILLSSLFEAKQIPFYNFPKLVFTV